MKKLFIFIIVLSFSISNGISQELNETKRYVSHKVRIIDGKESIIRTDIKYYDEKGNKVELISFNPDSSNYLKFSYEYDSRNNMTSLTQYGIDGDIKYKTDLKYDEYNNNIETTFWNPDFDIRKYLRKYKDQKLIKLTIVRDSSKRECFYKYDLIGRKILDRVYLYDSLEREIPYRIYEYDLFGRKIHDSFYEDDSLGRKVNK